MKKYLLVLILGLVSINASADDLEDILGVEADVKITLGPGMLGLANLFTKNEPEAQAVLSGLSDLSINVYELTNKVDEDDLNDWMSDTLRSLSRNGVEELVKVVDGDERVHQSWYMSQVMSLFILKWMVILMWQTCMILQAILMSISTV